MPDDDRPAPEDVASGADGPVGHGPGTRAPDRRLRGRARPVPSGSRGDRTRPQKEKDAINALVRTWTRPQAEKRSEAEAAPAPESAPEFKLPEHLAAARRAVDADGEAPGRGPHYCGGSERGGPPPPARGDGSPPRSTRTAARREDGSDRPAPAPRRSPRAPSTQEAGTARADPGGTQRRGPQARRR